MSSNYSRLYISDGTAEFRFKLDDNILGPERRQKLREESSGLPSGCQHSKQKGSEMRVSSWTTVTGSP